MNQNITIAVTAFLLGLVFYWAFLDKSGTQGGVTLQSEGNATSTVPALPVSSFAPTQKPLMNVKPGEPPFMQAQGTYELLISDQKAGAYAIIANVSVPQNAWVAIHNEIKGAPGVILGARRFRTGTYTNEQVKLFIAPLEAGKTYYAMMHGDDGDSVFDYQKDLPLQDSSGKVIMMKFTVK